MANEGKASVEIVGDVRDFARQTEKDLNDSLKKVKPNPVKVPLDDDSLVADANKAGEKLADGITRGADGRLRDARGKFVKAGADLADGITRGADGRLRDSRGKFVKAGTDIGDAAGDSAGRSFGSRFTAMARKGLKASADGLGKALSGAGGMLTKGLKGVVSGIGSVLGGIVSTVAGTFKFFFASLIGLVIQASPAIAAALTTAVGVGLGAAFIGLGALALRENKKLKEAAKGVVETLDEVGKKAAKPLLKPLTTALRDTSELIRQLKPEFTSIFKSLAPAIKPLNESFGRFVGFLVRGIKDSMPGITAALDGFGKGLETVGKTLGDFFRDLFANDKLIDNAAEGFMNLISMGIKPLGSLISGLTVLFAAWNNVIKLTSGTFLPRILEGFRMFVDGGTGMLDRIAQAWGPLGDAIQNVWNKIKDFAGEDNEKLLEDKFMAIVQAIKETWEPLKEFFTVLWNEIVAFLRRKWEEDFMPWWEGTARPWLENAIQGAFRAAWDAAVRVVGEKLSAMMGRIGGWLSALPGRIWGWISSIPGIFASMFSSAAARALAGAMQIVNGIRARLAQLPGQIRAILGAAKNAVIGAFAGAGGWLLNAGAQIINGLVAGIRAGIGRVQAAVRALAGSIPAWANGVLDINSPSRVMERVGDYTAQGLEVGFLKRENSLQRAIEGVAGSMSGWAAPTGQRGYGATTMTGGVNFTINISGATGESAGKRAAEQVLQQLAAAGLVR